MPGDECAWGATAARVMPGAAALVARRASGSMVAPRRLQWRMRLKDEWVATGDEGRESVRPKPVTSCWN
jgi:hypothetical protein